MVAGHRYEFNSVGKHGQMAIGTKNITKHTTHMMLSVYPLLQFPGLLEKVGRIKPKFRFPM